jgi:hypothetical protein
MKTFSAALVLVMLTGTAAFAQQPMSPAQSTTTGAAIPSFSETLLSAVPGNSVTVTDWYKQTIYDPSDARSSSGSETSSVARRTSRSRSTRSR